MLAYQAYYETFVPVTAFWHVACKMTSKNDF